MFKIILLFALFASLFTINKTALEYCEPFFLIGSRMTVAGILLVSFQVWREGHQGIFRVLSHMGPLFLLGFLKLEGLHERDFLIWKDPTTTNVDMINLANEWADEKEGIVNEN